MSVVGWRRMGAHCDGKQNSRDVALARQLSLTEWLPHATQVTRCATKALLLFAATAPVIAAPWTNRVASSRLANLHRKWLRTSDLLFTSECPSIPQLWTLFSCVRLDGLLDLLLDGFQVEARALLHRREFDGRLSELPDLLLRKLEAPELEGKPVVVGQRPLVAVWQPRPLERIEPEIGEDRPIDLDRAAQPAAGLVGETILEVVDAHCAQRAFGEVEDLVAVRWAFASNEIHLVVAVEVDLVGAVAEL